MSGLPIGTYTVNVTDAQGCIISESYTLTQPDLLEVVLTQNDTVLCNGNAQASLVANPTGGAGGNTFTWFDANDNTQIGNNQNIYNLVAGEYYVVVVDQNNNQATSQVFTVIQPDELTVTFTDAYGACGTADDWSITANVKGGTLPYTYSWSNGEDTQTIADLSAGTYMLVVVDANGCRLVQNHTTVVPETLQITETITQVNCTNACEGSIELDIAGGIPPYDILWNTGDTNANIYNLCPDTYNVTITDQKGCVFNYEYVIENPDAIIVDLGEDQTLCVGQSYELDIQTDLENVTYKWEATNGFTSTSPQVTLTEAGIYTASIITEQGCIGTDTIEIFTSEDGINAQFLVTSQAFAGEQIIIINTSDPIPEDGDWFLPQQAKIVETTEDTIVLIFDNPGVYEITLRSYQGNCYLDYTKSIVVQEARILPEIDDTDAPMITEYTLYPNPSSGVFNVDITLAQEAMASLRLYGIADGILHDDRELQGSNQYEEKYNLNLPAGTYILLLETYNAYQIRRIIIE